MSFTRVSKANPCPVCKKPDWCRVFGDGWVECMRVQSDRPAKSGGFMHRPGESGANHSHLRPPPKWQPPTINATKLMREWLAATPATALEDFAATLGVSTPSLVAVGAAWAAPHSAWAFPMCDGYGNVVGIRLRNERGKFAVRGSRQGIFLCTCGLTAPDDTAQPAGIGRLSAAATANGSQSRTLFVCEGPTDTAAAVELGFFAVGRPNCCCGGPESRSLPGAGAATGWWSSPTTTNPAWTGRARSEASSSCRSRCMCRRRRTSGSSSGLGARAR